MRAMPSSDWKAADSDNDGKLNLAEIQVAFRSSLRVLRSSTRTTMAC